MNNSINYTNDVINEFLGNKPQGIKGITSCPRPSGYHDAIIAYLKNRIKDIAGLSDDNIYEDKAHNIYFDIPATKGYENKDMVILQGHTDMVVAGLEREEWNTTAIDAVVDNDTIYARGHKTSLGADDGIGVAIALTILKHRDDFTHGPIRFLLTSDEDIGLVGAKPLDPQWLMHNNHWIKWLINIDAEEEGYVYRSCAGYSSYTFTQNYQPSKENALPHEYTLTIDGLIGGHSGIDIVKHRANADRLVYELLYALVLNNNSIQLVAHNHNRDTKHIDYSPNQLIANCKVIFKTNLEFKQIEDVLKQQLSKWQNEDRFNLDNWKLIKELSGIVENSNPSEHYVSSEESKTLIKFLGNYAFEPKDQNLAGLYFGILEYNDDKTAKASVNMGPVSLLWDNSLNKFIYQSSASARSSIGTKSTNEPYSINGLNSSYKNLAESANINFKQESFLYPWTKDDSNKLVQILVEGYKKLDVTPTIYDSLSGVEPSIWMEKSDGNIICSCVGPRTDGAHSINETLYTKTIDPCVKNIIYALVTIAK